MYTVYFLLFSLNHCVFMDLHVHPCGFSFFICLCLEGPILSHLEGSLCLPPVYSVHKNSCLSPAPQQVTHAFCHLCRQRITTPMNLQPEEEEKKNKKKHLAHHSTPTPPHDSLGTMKPYGLEGRKMWGKHPPPHPSCDFQLLALRFCWHYLLCIGIHSKY